MVQDVLAAVAAVGGLRHALRRLSLTHDDHDAGAHGASLADATTQAPLTAYLDPQTQTPQCPDGLIGRRVLGLADGQDGLDRCQPQRQAALIALHE